MAYFSEVFFEEEGGVELDVPLSAGDYGGDHVECSAVVLPPQLTVSSVSSHIFSLRLVTSSGGGGEVNAFGFWQGIEATTHRTTFLLEKRAACFTKTTKIA